MFKNKIAKNPDENTGENTGGSGYQNHLMKMNKLILVKLFLALNASAFGQAYNAVKSDYLDGDTYTIASINSKKS